MLLFPLPLPPLPLIVLANGRVVMLMVPVWGQTLGPPTSKQSQTD